MTAIAHAPATLDDLKKVKEKAELIGGRIVYFMATGFRPGRIGGRIFRSLDDYATQTKRGVACPDNVGFAVSELSSGRESFSPDAAYYDGPLPDDEMEFIEGAPTFAAEVRSKSDYGSAAELELAAKRADYFEAGTIVVWDVDPLANEVRSYRAASPDEPLVFTVGQMAHAEPAVAGWRMSLADLLA